MTWMPSQILWDFSQGSLFPHYISCHLTAYLQGGVNQSQEWRIDWETQWILIKLDDELASQELPSLRAIPQKRHLSCGRSTFIYLPLILLHLVYVESSKAPRSFRGSSQEELSERVSSCRQREDKSKHIIFWRYNIQILLAVVQYQSSEYCGQGRAKVIIFPVVLLARSKPGALLVTCLSRLRYLIPFNVRSCQYLSFSFPVLGFREEYQGPVVGYTPVFEWKCLVTNGIAYAQIIVRTMTAYVVISPRDMIRVAIYTLYLYSGYNTKAL